KQASCQAARGAITRYARWPTQAITYRLGREQIFALRERAQRELGAAFSLQRFHLAFMRQGTIPAGYFGEELLRALRATAPGHWRFGRRPLTDSGRAAPAARSAARTRGRRSRTSAAGHPVHPEANAT